MTEPEHAAPRSMTESTDPVISSPDSLADAPQAADSVPDDGSDAKRSRRWLRRSVAAFALLLLGSGGFMAWEWQKLGLSLSDGMHPFSAVPPSPDPVLPSAPAPLAADEMARQIASVQETVQTLQSRLAVNSPATDLNALGARLQQVESGLRHLDNQPKLPSTLLGDMEELRKTQAEMKRTSADAATVLRLLERLERAESQIRTLQERHANAVSLLLAVGQLREAIQRAMPYDDEWQVLRVLAAGNPEIQTALDGMTSHRASGIPTLTTLIQRFAGLAPALLRAEILPDGGSWWQRSLDRLAGLVLIRREDAMAAGDSVAAIVARSEAALAEQDLAGAVRELAALPSAASQRAAPWLRDATARLQADQALSAMTARLIAAQQIPQSGARQ